MLLTPALSAFTMLDDDELQRIYQWQTPRIDPQYLHVRISLIIPPVVSLPHRYAFAWQGG